ncbi:MAG TPA: chromosomal replication initiator protein DnaA [Vicinamibacterales bacterium]|jgi:chromosomal replication initiator protein|nr:chromosomal replication initiator protein DnaA [Vicinamibacterales bacterium]
MTSSVWDEVLARVETKVNRYSYDTWFRETSLVADLGNSLRIRVTDPTVIEWLTRNYAVILDEALTEVGRPGVRLLFQPDGHGGPASRRPEAPADLSSEELAGPEVFNPDDSEIIADVGGLSPRYSFDTFIVGASNQFAHAACRAVAEAPSRSYNPLFLYGGVGLGKTHLMHAIGHYVLTQSPGLKLTYISAERFMNEVVNAIRYDRILDFRERYRGVDVLLVDDVQFIVGKERTQTEFFHTFNALHDAQKQIVLSSDCPPHQISELEERLRSRFEWGLIADIQPPDLETKIAILKRKADAEGVPLPDDVALYIAGRIKSNIRELEGSLIRLLAYASLTGREVSMSLVQEVLRDVLPDKERAVTIDMIQKFVAEYYQIRLNEIKSKNNSKSIALPRQVAMYLCKSLTSSSLPEIGKSFGGKHHSTVIHSIRKVEEMRQRDAVFNNLINTLTESFR